MNENDIIKGCLRNDRASQKVLYEYFYDDMFSICLRYSKSTDEAKEIVQEGYLKVFTNLKSFNHSGSFEGWIKKIYIKRCYRWFAKYKRFA